MGLKDENILGFVENISSFLNTILFTGLEVDISQYEDFEELFSLKKELKEKIEKKEFNDAKNFLFDEIEKRRGGEDFYSYLRVGYWFFLKLNSLDEEDLKKGDFSKSDILNGMRKIEEYVMRR